MPVDDTGYHYTVSLLEQIGEQHLDAYDGMEIHKTILIQFGDGPEFEMTEVWKIGEPFSIAEFLADYDLSLGYVRSLKGSTEKETARRFIDYRLACDWLNGVTYQPRVLSFNR